MEIVWFEVQRKGRCWHRGRKYCWFWKGLRGFFKQKKCTVIRCWRCRHTDLYTSTHFVFLQKDLQRVDVGTDCMTMCRDEYHLLYYSRRIECAQRTWILDYVFMRIMNIECASRKYWFEKMEWMNRFVRICGLEFNADIDTHRSVRLFVRVPHVSIWNRASRCVASRFLTIQRQQNC